MLLVAYDPVANEDDEFDMVLGNLDPILLTLVGTNWVADVDTNSTSAMAIFEGLVGSSGVNGWQSVTTFMQDPLVDPATYLTLNSPTELQIDLPAIPAYLIFGNDEEVWCDHLPLWLTTSAPLDLGRLTGGFYSSAETPSTPLTPGFVIVNKATAQISGATSEFDIDLGAANTIQIELFDAIWDGNVGTNDGKAGTVLASIIDNGCLLSTWADLIAEMGTPKNFVTRNSDTIVSISFPIPGLPWRIHNADCLLTLNEVSNGAHSAGTIRSSEGATGGTFVIHNERK
jgi:hypothetical protein